jgi:plasmid maintenance system antidote protein VapI
MDIETIDKIRDKVGVLLGLKKPITKSELGRLIGLNYVTINRIYKNDGKTNLTPTVVRLLSLLDERPELALLLKEIHKKEG